jgi:hypothetical protein
MLVIPPKLVAPHIEGRVMSLIIVVAKLDYSMSEHDSSTYRSPNSIAGLGEGFSTRCGKPAYGWWNRACPRAVSMVPVRADKKWLMMI